MLEKIISGGQTGADQAALDIAIEMSIPHGGWIPKGRKTENGPLPEKYQLKEIPTTSYAERTEKNVLDSHGTLLFSYGRLKGGSKLTWDIAEKNEKPCLHLDLTATNAFKAAGDINFWVKKNKIEILNVAGPRASDDPDIYEAVKKILKSFLYLSITSSNMPDHFQAIPNLPRTIEEAVKRLDSEMPFKDKTSIANMKEEDLVYLNPVLREYIINKFGLWSENKELMQSYRIQSGKDGTADEASFFIVKRLWLKLRETHALRVVK